MSEGHCILTLLGFGRVHSLRSVEFQSISNGYDLGHGVDMHASVLMSSHYRLCLKQLL